MSEEPLSPDSAAPKKPRRVSTPRPRKTAKVAKEKPVAAEAVAAPEAPAAKPATKQAAARVPRDPRLDDISGHEGPPARSSEPRESEKAPAPRQDRVRSNVRDARSEDVRAEDSSNARPERTERSERPPSNRPREIREEDDSASRARWPEPETIQGGDNPPSSGKRKRRRKKKGGQSAQGSFAGPSQGQDGFVAESSQAAPQEAPANVTRPQPQASPQGPRIAVDAEAVAKKAWKIFLGEVGEEGLALIGDQDARDLTKRSFRLAEIFLEEQARRER